MKQGNRKCSDCGAELVRNGMELICPECGIVEDLIEGT
jgi:exosome complex RNA-binding protein Csl4